MIASNQKNRCVRRTHQWIDQVQQACLVARDRGGVDRFSVSSRTLGWIGTGDASYWSHELPVGSLLIDACRQEQANRVRKNWGDISRVFRCGNALAELSRFHKVIRRFADERTLSPPPGGIVTFVRFGDYVVRGNIRRFGRGNRFVLQAGRSEIDSENDRSVLRVNFARSGGMFATDMSQLDWHRRHRPFVLESRLPLDSDYPQFQDCSRYYLTSRVEILSPEALDAGWECVDERDWVDAELIQPGIIVGCILPQEDDSGRVRHQVISMAVLFHPSLKTVVGLSFQRASLHYTNEMPGMRRMFRQLTKATDDWNHYAKAKRLEGEG
ncbi:hypothetical protein [Crateriforma conspicua]|uniref:Uncharacterized protein n=1 Tax=Crateriforma conspicua TaxID=2527996 RepID=A0A5C6FIU1_9PLAN|nr:hypothetical protein V7x_54960 [Crateriforma conspicua]